MSARYRTTHLCRDDGTARPIHWPRTRQVGRTGDRENTIVCFTSDNGGVSSGDAYATSNLPLRGGKGRQWEGGIREPYYIKAPGVSQSRLHHRCARQWDRLVPHPARPVWDCYSQEAKSRRHKPGVHTPAKTLTSPPALLALSTLWKPGWRALLHHHGRRLETDSLPRDGARRAL